MHDPRIKEGQKNFWSALLQSVALLSPFGVALAAFLILGERKRPRGFWPACLICVLSSLCVLTGKQLAFAQHEPNLPPGGADHNTWQRLLAVEEQKHLLHEDNSKKTTLVEGVFQNTFQRLLGVGDQVNPDPYTWQRFVGVEDQGTDRDDIIVSTLQRFLGTGEQVQDPGIKTASALVTRTQRNPIALLNIAIGVALQCVTIVLISVTRVAMKQTYDFLRKSIICSRSIFTLFDEDSGSTKGERKGFGFRMFFV
ncbi:unnamed protein product [Amoebophrya sp. A25]|nr:unnamed protein product [Amoebophrya sp. A25]|eukprot:GSA25T00017239001.1